MTQATAQQATSTAIAHLCHLYLLSPLHTGGATQEGNLLGIARESHTDLPYIPSSTIRGRLRASVADQSQRFALFGNEINVGENLTQGSIWIGDGSLLWIPISSLSHGVIWVTCPLLLRRYHRYVSTLSAIPAPYSTNLNQSKRIYLKDAILQDNDLHAWAEWKQFIPRHDETATIQAVLVLPDRHFSTVVQMGLWRQVKVKLSESKEVEGGFRYEEAIPPDTVMYFPWGVTAQAQEKQKEETITQFTQLMARNPILQIGGQESLGRGFTQQWS
ncbi:MAG: type III-B CRISPR module RAMP protein Cmr4 [Cyanobacteria bacterium]|nr:type III-B CRISPR module RAMP protein Cmr4 [Cyanobacteriota bacterium]